MRSWLSLALGVVIGHALTFGGRESLTEIPTGGAVAHRVHDLARTAAPTSDVREATVSLEPARGVWVVPVTLNGGGTARFLVDTGASVTMLSPGLAEQARVRPAPDAGRLEMTTLAGPAGGPIVTIDSLVLGGLEIRRVPAVIHESGFGVDGILGNTVLARFAMTLDADRRILHLRPFPRP